MMLLRFFLKSLLVIMPALLTLGYVEIKMRGIGNSYTEKYAQLMSVAEHSEVLIVGSSNAYYGIDPSDFAVPGYNMANRAQSMYYDKEILLRNLNRFKSLKLVVIPFIYLTFGTELEDLSDSWRVYFYDSYFGIPRNPRMASFWGWRYWLDPKRYSRIALFGERTFSYIATRFDGHSEAPSQARGWFDAGSAPMNKARRIGPLEGPGHNGQVHIERYDRNLEYVDQMVTALTAQGIQVVFVMLPINKEIFNFFDPQKFGLMEKKVEAYAQVHNIAFHNYTRDERFLDEDFTDLPDHLNALGAHKFSRIFYRDAIGPKLRP